MANCIRDSAAIGRQVKPVSEHKGDSADTVRLLAGKLANHMAKRRELANDEWVLDCVQHYHIELMGKPYQIE